MNYVTDTHALAWYFSEDHRLSQKALAAFESTIESGQVIVPLDVNILTTAAEFDEGLEMHDLLIVATARYYNATLITADAQIQSANLAPTVW